MPLERRVWGLKPDLADIRDKTFRKDYLKVGKFRQKVMVLGLPSAVDLRTQPMPPVFDQGNLGSCVDNALATMLGHVTHDEGYGVEIFSRLFMYGNARDWEPVDDGSTLRDAIKGLDRHGVPLEAMWPYDLSKWKERPPQDVWDAAEHRHEISYYRLETLDGMKLCLAEGYPWIFGISVFTSFAAKAPDYTIPLPTYGDRLEGGHAMCAVGYDDKRAAFAIRNSWGDDWGDEGHAWLPYEYVADDRLFMDAWTVRTIPA